MNFMLINDTIIDFHKRTSRNQYMTDCVLRRNKDASRPLINCSTPERQDDVAVLHKKNMETPLHDFFFVNLNVMQDEKERGRREVDEREIHVQEVTILLTYKTK